MRPSNKSAGPRLRRGHRLTEGMMKPAPRRKRIDKCLLHVNRYGKSIAPDVVDLLDFADYIGLADPDSVDKFLKFRGFIVKRTRRDDE